MEILSKKNFVCCKLSNSEFLLEPYGYRKITESYCKIPGRKGSYTSFEEALRDCTNIAGCEAVEDFNCEGGRYRRCDGKENLEIRPGGTSSCLYKKEETGNKKLYHFKI